jgi:Tfp pilus assembly protein FimT
MGRFTNVTQTTKSKELSKEENAMKKTRSYAERGASVIEMLIVLTVVAILVTFAVAQFGSANESYERQNLAKEFKIHLERARFDSVKRRASNLADMAMVNVLNSTSYNAATDLNQNGTIDTSDIRNIDFSGRTDVKIYLASGLNFPVLIRFDRQGHALITDSSGNPVDHFIFCGKGCTAATANGSNSNIVYISPTGTVAMMGGGESIPNFNAPNVSNTWSNSNSGINPELSVMTGTPPTPTPVTPPVGTATPTPSPSPSTSPVGSPPASPSPTVSPSPSPSVSPSVSPTASPSPTPLPACALGQTIGSPPACDCSGLFLQSKNGKCVKKH